MEEYKWELHNSHRGVKYSTQNIINNIVITLYGARWVPEILRDHFINYINV